MPCVEKISFLIIGFGHWRNGRAEGAVELKSKGTEFRRVKNFEDMLVYVNRRPEGKTAQEKWAKGQADDIV